MHSFWVFGYGSLIWRPDFPFEERITGYISGWSRRFFQGSTDHRGLPHAPGRVVTLTRERKARCWGVAYRISHTGTDVVLNGLDTRESGGYERHFETFHKPGGELLDASVLVYLASHTNPNYLGPAPIEEIAAQIVRATGPSGTNIEYLLRLAESLRALNLSDDHVFALEHAAKRLISHKAREET